jgi:peptidylprolyl isomerase
MKSKAILLTTILALAVFAAGCGKGASYSDVNANSTPPASEGSSTDSTGDSGSETSGKTVMPKVSGSASEKPELSDASGQPPSKMIEKDITKGDGKTAKDGDEVEVNYVGHNWSNNEEFDTSWGKTAFTFTLGQGQVIKGWDQGVVGMKEGGRRLLIIPPDLGYGDQGQGSIPAGETLIFVVDLKKIK